MKKVWICIIFVALVSCNATSSQLSETPTSLPAETITPTPLPVLIPTSTFTPSPTWTPLPTIPPEDVQSTILNWVETNRGCRYPCWWGIMPGETDWNSAKAFLNTISPKWWVPDSKDFVKVSFPLPDNWSYTSKGGAEFYVKDGIVESIQTFTDIPLTDFISEYGMPDEIWISYHPYDLAGYYYFVVLYYPSEGFALLFGKEVFENDGNAICPYRSFETETLTDGYGKVHVIDHPTIGINLWNPEYQKPFHEILSQMAGTEEFKSLDEITNVTVQEFSAIISDINNRTCIDIKK